MSAPGITNLDRHQILLVRTLLWFGPLARPKLSQLAGFSRGQTNRLLDDLSARGWIRYGVPEHENDGIGRPATQIALNAGLGFLLAVTLQDDEGRITLATSDLKKLGTRSFAYSFTAGAKKLLNSLEREIRALFSNSRVSPRRLLAVAISAPGPVETQDPPIFRPHPALGWHGFDIVAYLRNTFRKPVFIDNDANVSTIGELLYARSRGQSAGRENWLVVKMSASGIGAGIVSNGLIHRGETGLAGEIGHVEVDPAGPRCACGLKGCLESLISLPVLLERARLDFSQRGAGGVPFSVANRNNITLSDLELAAQAGDEFANSLLLEVGTRLGSVVAGAVSILNPRKVILTGQLARMAPLILATVRQSIYGGSLPVATHTIDVEYLQNPDAETDGALVYAFERFLDAECSAASLRPVLSALS